MAKPITIEILGDNKSFLKAADSTGKRTQSLGKRLARLGAIAATGFAAVGVVKLGKDLFELGKNLELTDSQISTVFEDNEARVRKWADSVNETFGLTETGVASLAASTADLLKPLGFTADVAADLSTELVGLAPALSNWSKGQFDAAQVADILNKAVLGEREGLKALGISINQAEVNERALAIARSEGRSEIEKTDQALATQQLIFEKSTDAQTAFAEGSGPLAAAQDLLRTRWAELQEFLARKLIPIFASAADFIVNTVLPAVSSLAGFLSDTLGPVFSDIGDKWSEFVETLRTGFTEDEGTPIERFALFLRNDLAPVLSEVFGFIKREGPKVVDAIGSVLGVLRDIGEWVVGNRPVLIGLGVAIGTGLVVAFTAWAVSATAAAVATVAATAPIILIGVAIAALVAGIIWAYQNVDIFRDSVDAVGRFLRDTLLPALRSVWSFIAQSLIPILASISSWLRDRLGPIVATVARLIGSGFVTSVRTLSGVIRVAIAIVRVIISVIRAILPVVSAVIGAFRRFGSSVASGVRFIRGQLSSLRRRFGDLLAFIRRLGTRIRQAITSPFRAAFDWVRRQFNRLKRTLSGGISIPNPISGIRSAISRFNPFRQAGGPVARSQVVKINERGPENVVLPRGAEVIPAHRPEPVARQITVNAVTQADPVDIAREIAWLLRTTGR